MQHQGVEYERAVLLHSMRHSTHEGAQHLSHRVLLFLADLATHSQDLSFQSGLFPFLIPIFFFLLGDIFLKLVLFLYDSKETSVRLFTISHGNNQKMRAKNQNTISE